MCEVFGCGKPEFRRGMCSMHYSRLMRHGVLAVSNGRGLSAEELFWRNVSFWSIKNPGCFEWKARRNSDGYGKITLGRYFLAHRAAWWIHYGAVPEGLNVLHKCDNPACVNPDHLFLGTQNDNIQDMIRKGRKVYGVCPRGEAHGRAKLTAAQVAEIRKDPRLSSVVSEEYGVSPSQIYRVRSGANWGAKWPAMRQASTP